MKTNEEKLIKINSDIDNENLVIIKSKEKIKKLKKQKKEIEFRIAKEKNTELFKYLSEFGIKTVEDFQRFINNNPQNALDENKNIKNENY